MNQTARANIWSDMPEDAPDELFDVLAESPSCRIERIVSFGNASPEGFWYDQDRSEWVVLLQGKACLEFEDPREDVVLVPGDYVNIPAHRRHRVKWTSHAGRSVWLAVHYAT
ncbi:MAG: cupin domain-containing protein [Verrucomicrobia bacterium]|nr:cupin domain-containing protein [Verrucomicrobiota bacterium]